MDRGIRVLLDPVFSNTMGPWGLVGPKRFSALPCALEDVPEVDAVCISHNHYDHLDVETIKKLYAGRKRDMHFFCGLNIKSWFIASGVEEKDITELDWWHGVDMKVANVGQVRLICTPSQHFSGRSISDRGHALWCSWVVEEMGTTSPHKLYFAGI
jgi:L-ascorbate metabolism protein UlaG (beta-lactamase superfamily)